MPPRGVKKGTKRARQYEHIKKSEKRGSLGEGEEIAARAVNKERRSGESRSPRAARSATARRAAAAASARATGRGKTREQLYNDARS